MKVIKICFFLLFMVITSNAQSLRPGDASGLFLDLGIAPKIPLDKFGDSHSIGVGFSLNFAYTDNNQLPIFYYTKIEYNHFPGNQNFYKGGDHSAISTNMLAISPGIRYYFSPFIENVVILMPVIEAGATYAYSTTYNEYKVDTGKKGHTEEYSKYGFHVGAGVSMFLLDVMGYYTYLNKEQFLSFDLKLRIPVYLKMQ